MAAALVGGAFLSAALQVLFDRLASPDLLNFFRGRKRDESLLRKLKLTLLELNAMLDDAEKQQVAKLSVRDWLDELKDAVYYADDLLDEIATQVLLCKSEAQFQSSTNQVHHITSTCIFDENIESKLEEVIDRLEYFAKAKDFLGLAKGFESKSSHRLPSTSLVDESSVFGRDNDKEHIVELLVSDEAIVHEIDVIAIVGMGGLGKTTLAQLLYNDGRVDRHFDVKAWVCITAELDVFKATKTILEAISLAPCGTEDLNVLQVKLRDSLCRKKFLIVLDDIWNKDDHQWEILRSPFRVGAHGSKIIITTRDDGVASIMKTVPTHRLQLLSDDDCWKLFVRHAFREGEGNAHPDLERIGKDIVKKCKGLPLATKTLGCLLHSKLDIEEWDNILKSQIWELPEDKNNVIQVLGLSYHYLPSHLKQCFAYCSIFPKGYEFEKKKLILLWIAQNFVQKPKSNKSLEKVGDEYFHELLLSSFFQQSSGDSSTFIMHDLVHDLAQVMAGLFSFRLDEGKQGYISTKVRHFSYIRGQYDGFEKFKAINEVKCLRTFLPIQSQHYLNENRPLYLSKRVLDGLLPTLRCLWALSLSYYEIMELPDSIGNLIHLRYLDLSETKIKELPETICSLCNLQILLLSDCRFLVTLPGEMGKLICLWHLDISGTNLMKMPMLMSRLKGLQRLTVFVVGNKCKGSGINELKELHNLRGKLSISSLENVKSGREALEAKLKEKKYLEELALEWGGIVDNSDDDRVLDNLQPHTNLKLFAIKNYRGRRFPSWLGDPTFSNIASVSIYRCDYCLQLPPFGQLPSLKHLVISRVNGITEVGQEFYGGASLAKPFQSLETLIFEEMLEWVEWHILGADEFPKLQKLCIIKCPKLIGGLPKDVPSLVRFEIQDCSGLMASISSTFATGDLVLKGSEGVELQCEGGSSLVNLEISHMPNLEELMPELCTLTNLRGLRIEECPRLLSFPSTGFTPTLTTLSIERCPKLMFPLSEMEHCYTSLESLSLCKSDSLKSFPIGLFPKLRDLSIVNCAHFVSFLIPNRCGLQKLTSLDSLNIVACSNMANFPQGGLPAPNLTRLWIWKCKKLESLPEQMHSLLSSLQDLWIMDCPEIESFPVGGLPSNLNSLDIENCKKLVASWREWDIHMISLFSFRIKGVYDGVLDSFPEEGLLPSTIRRLNIKDLPNLKSLNNMGFQLLSSLENLYIRNCPQLKSLPEDGLPDSLSVLEIRDCPLLRRRCQKDKGDDWRKIACIPFVKMDNEVIIL